MTSAAVPLVSGSGGLVRYLGEIKRFPLLDAHLEYALAKRWRENEDREAARQLITSHLRLVVKIAMRNRAYGLPMSEIVSEGNIGLMQALKRFEPERGFRFATYAMWWIKASIQEYIVRSWSLVKISAAANQKKLFFNLRRVKRRIEALDGTDLRSDQIKQIAKQLGTTEKEVADMDSRLAGDVSLNVPLREGEGEWQDRLVDEGDDQERKLVQSEEATIRHDALVAALGVLDPRERRIFEARRLVDDPMTLADLAAEFGVSRERVRQLELRGFEKLQREVKTLCANREVARASVERSPTPVRRSVPSRPLTAGRARLNRVGSA